MSLAKRKNEQAAELVEITAELLEAGMRGGQGMKKAQAAALGIPWPLKSGWKDRIIGKIVDESTFDLFCDMKAKMPAKQSLAMVGLKTARATRKKRRKKSKLRILPLLDEIPDDETAMSFEEWNQCGCRIRKGEKASSFDPLGVPQFTAKQVVSKSTAGHTSAESRPSAHDIATIDSPPWAV